MSGNPVATHPRTPAERDALLKDVAGKIPGRPNPRRRMLWMICLVIGVVAFAALLMTEPRRAWGAYTINALYWMGIAQGGVVLACGIRLSNGRWAGPVLRIAEALSAFLPWGIGLMAILLVAGIWTYLPWVRHVNPHQAPYLNVPFLYIRTLGGLALLWWLSRDLVRTSLRTDAYLLKDRVAPELKARYERLCQGWRGDQQEVAWQRHRFATRTAQIAVLYAVVYTLLAWDFVMSLTPEWTSTLFGWWFFIGAFLTGVAMTAFLSTRLRSSYRIEAYLTPHHFWDIGKIMFALTIFWTYQYWSQYLVIWYANLPDETWWVFLRFEHPWRLLAFSVFGLVFVVPFLGLLNQFTKQNPFWLAFFSVMIMVGMWLERHVLVMPSLEPDKVWVGLPEVGVTIGFLGLFGFAVQGFLSRYPTVKVADLLEGGGGHGH